MAIRPESFSIQGEADYYLTYQSLYYYPKQSVPVYLSAVYGSFHLFSFSFLLFSSSYVSARHIIFLLVDVSTSTRFSYSRDV